MIRCAVCGNSWIESRAMTVIDAVALQEQAAAKSKRVEQDLIAEREVARLAQAARAAEAKFAAARARRRKERRGWVLLAASIALPAAVAMTMPQEVARAFPPSRMIYSLAGLDINISELAFRHVGQQHRIIDGVRVLAIQGEIVNVGQRERKIPPLAFYLQDDRLKAIYDWRLSTATRPIKPGEVSSFVTRLASPPDQARHIEIRFARPGETGSNARP
jgi:hypothetical protein